MAEFEAIHRLCTEITLEKIAFTLVYADIRGINAFSKKIAMIGVENTYPNGEDLSLLTKYHKQGARYILLAHNGHNRFCDSPTREQDGL